MLCWTNCAIACIFANCGSFPAVRVATCCLISGDASRRPARRPEYHLPMSLQPANPLTALPSGGNSVTIICPITPLTGGIAGSLRIGPTSVTVHCQRLLPPSVGLSSGWLSHADLYSHPGGSCKE